MKQEIDLNNAIMDPAKVFGLLRLKEDSDLLVSGQDTYEKPSEEVRFFDERKSHRTVIYKGDEKWSVLTKEMFDQCKDILKKITNSNSPDFYLADKKDRPIIMRAGDVGAIIAPRVDDEEDNQE